jgi:hypothetical protein
MERDRGTHAQAAAAICLFWFARSVDSWRFLSFCGVLPRIEQNQTGIDKNRQEAQAR